MLLYIFVANIFLDPELVNFRKALNVVFRDFGYLNLGEFAEELCSENFDSSSSRISAVDRARGLVLAESLRAVKGNAEKTISFFKERPKSLAEKRLGELEACRDQLNRVYS